MLELAPWLIGLALIALVWWSAMGAKARARAAARAACEDAEMLFIDELALKRLHLARDAHGKRRLARRYGFEFYQRGDRRYGGIVDMHGLHVARVQLEAHPFSEESA